MRRRFEKRFQRMLDDDFSTEKLNRTLAKSIGKELSEIGK